MHIHLNVLNMLRIANTYVCILYPLWSSMGLLSPETPSGFFWFEQIILSKYVVKLKVAWSVWFNTWKSSTLGHSNLKYLYVVAFYLQLSLDQFQDQFWNTSISAIWFPSFPLLLSVHRVDKNTEWQWANCFLHEVTCSGCIAKAKNVNK